LHDALEDLRLISRRLLFTSRVVHRSEVTFDAILGRNFLQENRVLIDLDRSSVTFNGTGYLGKHTSSPTDPVIKTSLLQVPQKKDLKENKVATPKAELKSLKAIKPQQVIPNRKCKHMDLHWSLLVNAH